MGDLEQRTFEIASQIFKEAKKYHRGPEEIFVDTAMEFLMKNEKAKVPILQFLECKPSLPQSAVQQHIKEYIIDADLGFLSKGARLVGITPTKWINKLSEFMAGRYIAGRTIKEAVRQYPRSGPETYTFDFLGELTTSRVGALRHRAENEKGLDALAEHFVGLDSQLQPRINLSLKLSAHYEHFDPIDPGTCAGVREQLDPIMEKIIRVNGFANFDVEEHHVRDLTTEIFMDIHDDPRFRNLHSGIVVQSVLKDSEKNVDELLYWAEKGKHPLTIRLVKGAYWDQEVKTAMENGWEIPVFTNKKETDANYEHLSRKILDKIQKSSAELRLALASHHIRSVAHGVAYAQVIKVDPRHLEVQKLRNVANPIGYGIRRVGIPVRSYETAGELIPGMGYQIRRILENSSNESFVRAFNPHADIATIMANPAGGTYHKPRRRLWKK
jgi:RHH-type transcriptional regulator, proline utilization regulon repressor / proline dehydrogenase / delta 1-pyrroline-5-carboxylate dehydrogenase